MIEELSFDPKKELGELVNQLSISRKIGFFFGAGVSTALGIPDIKSLTKNVLEKVEDKEIISNFSGNITPSIPGNAITIEDILNELRLIRMLTKESESKVYENINGKIAKKLDVAICKKIYEEITLKESSIDISPMKAFIAWLNWLNRDFTKEVFTSNYDLVIESALEQLKVPYFDGFIGGHHAFFHPESVEIKKAAESLPLSWIRLWKLHGSFGWYWKQEKTGFRIIRTNASIAEMEKEGAGEVVIYPSREKYDSSRKQPFIAFLDRFSTYLQDGEGLFIISGYSFSDQHINQLVFNSIKQNNRLHVVALLFDDEPMKTIMGHLSSHMNFSAFSPKEAIIGGRYGKWLLPTSGSTTKEEIVITQIGEFKTLVKFLIENSARKNQIEESLK